MALARCINNHLYSVRRYGSLCPYCPQPEPQEDESGLVKRPVVGWLVCIQGANAGRDFKIVAGRNAIGRDQDMRIRILGDPRIRNRDHAVIAFDDQTRITKLVPNESAQFVYCNGDAAYLPVDLENYDTLILGTTVFKFIRLCGDNFSWEQNKPAAEPQSNPEPEPASSHELDSQTQTPDRITLGEDL